MRSPFPGMDPYIEACGLWEGFHGHLIEAIYQALAPVLPRGYTIDTAVRSYVVLMEAESKREQLAKSYVTVTEPAGKKKPRKKNKVCTKHGTGWVPCFFWLCCKLLREVSWLSETQRGF